MERRTTTEQTQDPRNSLLKDATKQRVATEIADCAMTLEGYLSYGAFAHLTGMPDQTGAAMRSTKHANANWMKEHSQDDAWIFEFVATNAYAKLLGVDIEIKEDDKKLIQKKIDEVSDRQLVELQRQQVPYWQTITEAKILGLEVNTTERAKGIRQSQTFNETYILKGLKNWDEYDRTTLQGHYTLIGGHASGKAQARILGIDIPTSPKMLKLYEKTLLLAEKEGAIIFIPQLAADLAIIKAKDIKVGGEKGLELIF